MSGRVHDRAATARTPGPARPQGTLGRPWSCSCATATTPTTGKVLPGRAPGLHLADTGHAQAEVAAERIAALDPPPAAIYASPLERTRETAAPIARALGLRSGPRTGLIECDIGEWTGGIGAVNQRPEWATVQRWPSGFRFPGGESFAEMSTRATEAVLGLVAAHPGETVVAVSHADPIKAVVAAPPASPSTCSSGWSSRRARSRPSSTGRGARRSCA